MVDIVGDGCRGQKQPRLEQTEKRTGSRVHATWKVFLSSASALALVLLLIPSAESNHSRLMDAGQVQMGHDFANHGFFHNEAPASLGSGTTAAVLRYSPTGSMGAAYEGVTRGIDHNYQNAWLVWNVGFVGPAGPQSGGCYQRPPPQWPNGGAPCFTGATSGQTNGTVWTPPAPTAAHIPECAYVERAIGDAGGAPAWGRPLYASHDTCPVKPNVYRVDVLIRNNFMDQPMHDVRYRRAMEWNAETLPAGMSAPQFVSIGGSTPPPLALVAFGDDGRAMYHPWMPFASPVCAPSGTYFDNCTAGRGFVFDFAFGTLAPGEEVTFCIYYGGAPSYAQALADLRKLNVELYSIAYRGSDAPVTFFMGIGCLSPPIVDFTWAAEPHIHAPPGWTPLTACVGSKVRFDDLSYLNGLEKGQPAKSAWSFGEGNGTTTSWSDSVEHTYMAPGTYNVSLTVWAADDRNVTVTKPITVIECLPAPPVNEAPSIASLPCRTVTEGSWVTMRLVAFDPDTPPDPPAFYTLSWFLVGAPSSVQVVGDQLRWEASALGEHRFKVQVRDGGPPVLMDETEVCITVYPQKPAPESSDADGDGVPDAHDPCPATAGATGCPKEASDLGSTPEGSGGQDGAGGGCEILDLVPRDVEARSGDDHVAITWRAPPGCLVDRFLVWNGTQGDLIASVPFDPDVEVYEAIDAEPWDRPHRYYVQAEGGPGVDAFVYPRAVPTNPVVFLACADCDAGPPAEPASDDVPPIGGISSIFVGVPSQLLMPGLPIILLLLAAWWLWHSYGVLVRVFSRIDGDKALEHPTRARLHEAVAADPGIHARELARRLDKARGVVRHHLGILVAAGLVHTRKDGGYTRYYVAEADARREGARTDLAKRILSQVRDQPGMNITELADGLGVNRNAVRYHLQRFREAGLVDLERTPGGVVARAPTTDA